MAILQPPISSRIIGDRQPGFFSTFMAKQLCANAMFINNQVSSVLKRNSGGSSSNCGGAYVRVRNCPRSRKSTKIQCRFSSPNDGDSITGNFEGDDGDYVNSTVIEAGIIHLQATYICYFSLFFFLEFSWLLSW